MIVTPWLQALKVRFQLPQKTRRPVRRRSAPRWNSPETLECRVLLSGSTVQEAYALSAMTSLPGPTTVTTVIQESSVPFASDDVTYYYSSPSPTVVVDASSGSLPMAPADLVQPPAGPAPEVAYASVSSGSGSMYNGQSGTLAFTVVATCSSSNYLQISQTNNSYGYNYLQLDLLNSSGTVIASSGPKTGTATLNLGGLAPGNYYMGVYGYYVYYPSPATFNYTLNLPNALSNDVYEPNNSFAAATDLGVVQGTIAPPNPGSISYSGDVDYYKFQLAGTGTSSDYVSIAFSPSEPGAILGLFDGNGNFITQVSTGQTSNGFVWETIPLNGAPAGTYYFDVLGIGTNTLSQYWIGLHGPSAGPPSNLLTPAQIRQAYGANSISIGGVTGDGTGQTIAIVDAYDAPDIINDLHAFNVAFGLPDPPSFQVLNQNGGTTRPGGDPDGPGGWAAETTMDVQWAHAIAPNANIILILANSSSTGDLYTAIDTARHISGVSVISMSFGMEPEQAFETQLDPYFTTPVGHQGITFVASAGDSGAPGGFPALSPNVVAVGGTQLSVDGAGNYVGEVVWNDGYDAKGKLWATGGGISQYEPEPTWQQSVQNTGHRTSPDLAMNAAGSSAVAVFQSAIGWHQGSGTSLSAPMFAGLMAIVNQGRALAGLGSLDGATETLPGIYSLPSSDFHDITTGNNGTYSATVGYDLVSGRGSPIASLFVSHLATYQLNQAPTNLSLSATTIAENQPSGTTVGTFSATDPDAGDTFTYTLVSGTGSTDNASFTISGNQLKTAASFDFETKNSYSIRVRVTDAGGLTFEKVFTITVTNVNEAPTNVALSNASVAENQPSGTTVGTFSATDPDAGDTFTYTLVSGTGSTDNASFTISGNQLKTAASFDFETKNSYSIRVRVTDAGGLTFEKAFTITVIDVVENVPPTIGDFGGNVVFAANGTAPVLIAGLATVTDPDSPNFGSGVLTVQLTKNAQTEDVLSIRSVLGGNFINASDGKVFVGTLQIGTFTGGTGTTPLVVTLNANATLGRTAMLLRNLQFSNTSGSPSTAVRTVQVTLTDGYGGTSAPVSKGIGVIYNPVISDFGNGVTYLTGGAAQLLSPTATVTDNDSATFAGGTLTVQLTKNAQPDDLLSIRSVLGGNYINVSGGKVYVGTLQIGTFTGGTGTTPLVVTLNANATVGRTAMLLRNLLYSNASSSTSTAARTVQVILTDGSGGSSTPVSKSINVISANLPPVIGSFGSDIAYLAGGTAQLLSPTATVTDNDSAIFAGGTLTVQLTTNAQSDDLLSIRSVLGGNYINVSGGKVYVGTLEIGTFTGGMGTTPLVVTLNANATVGRTAMLLRNLQFSNMSVSTSTAARTVQVTLNDGQGATSLPVTKQIQIA